MWISKSCTIDTSMKLQTIWNWSNSRKVLQIQMEKGFFFLFEIPESHLQSLPVKCPATVNVCLSWVWGRGKVYWLGSDSTISQDVQQHRFKSKNKLYVTKRTALYLDSLVLILLWRLLPPINSNLMMCGFQRSRIHVPSFGKSFCII